jgi:hypothetical protein
VDLKSTYQVFTSPRSNKAAFASQSQRFTPAAATATPGPGAYNPEVVTAGAAASVATDKRSFNITYDM